MDFCVSSAITANLERRLIGQEKNKNARWLEKREIKQELSFPHWKSLCPEKKLICGKSQCATSDKHIGLQVKLGGFPGSRLVC